MDLFLKKRTIKIHFCFNGVVVAPTPSGAVRLQYRLGLTCGYHFDEEEDLFWL